MSRKPTARSRDRPWPNYPVQGKCHNHIGASMTHAKTLARPLSIMMDRTLSEGMSVRALHFACFWPPVAPPIAMRARKLIPWSLWAPLHRSQSGYDEDHRPSYAASGWFKCVGLSKSRQKGKCARESSACLSCPISTRRSSRHDGSGRRVGAIQNPLAPGTCHLFSHVARRVVGHPWTHYPPTELIRAGRVDQEERASTPYNVEWLAREQTIGENQSRGDRLVHAVDRRRAKRLDV